MPNIHRCAGVLLVLMFLCGQVGIAEEVNLAALREGFQNPPESAWPRTWWHWTRGAITKDGITKDLEWMKRAGIAGFQLADVSFGSGQTIEPPVDFGSDEWLDALKHAASEAERLDLEMTLFSSPGWSITGGPWVKPHEAMKKLVWSKTEVVGPSKFREKLPQPPTNNGPFQDIGGSGRDLKYYRDVRVIAFRTPSAEVTESDEQPRVTTSSGEIESELLVDERFNKRVTIKPSENGGSAWIKYSFDEPQTIRAINVAGPAGIPVGRIAVSDDGETFRTIVSLPGSQLYRQGRVRTFAFPATTAQHFRLEMTAAPLDPAVTINEPKPQAAKEYSLTEFKLHREARIHRWEEKAGFGHLFEYESVPTPAVDKTWRITSDSAVDLSEHLSEDGTLNWDAPGGNWTILRFGFSLTGAKSRPANPGGLGYEVDKLSRRHTESYYKGYTEPLKQVLGDLFGRRLNHFLIDSWEAGQQNWTDDMIAEFTRRRGYDPTLLLPAMAGYVVGDAETSDRFLWDFRRTLADMFAENHYGTMVELLHRDGLQVYSEASGVSLEIPEDTLLTKSKVDIPMGEFWMRDLHPRLMYRQDVRGAASAGHIYGKPIIAAESFTGGGYESPFSLKKASDYWLAQGINRLVFHTSAHQPLDTLPGNTMVGTHLHRHITWAELAQPLNEYFARTCYLLQQGRNVTDIAYLLPEGAPSTMPIWGAGTQPTPPEGYDYDFLNTDILLNQLTVTEDGRLEIPGRASYRVLILPQITTMTPEVLTKLRQLVEAGATILGPKPLGSPSLRAQPTANVEVAELAAILWGDLNGTTRTVNYIGKGTVMWGRTLEDVLNRLKVVPDFEWSSGLDTHFAWKHRRLDDTDVYYLSNLIDRPVDIEVRCRVSGRDVQLWRPDSGDITTATCQEIGDRTIVSLSLAANETLFLVFHEGTTSTADSKTQEESWQELAEVSGEWEVVFPSDRGAPDRVTMPKLTAWNKHEDLGVRHFSGTAEYKIEFDADENWLSSTHELSLDLGMVYDIAEVTLNGKPLGIAWKSPYSVDVTDAIQSGANQLTVRITNQWTNRIVGDRAAPEEERILTGLDVKSRFGPRELVESGLLGPVRILAAAQTKMSPAGLEPTTHGLKVRCSTN
jgi:hypothetical protein